MHTEKKLTPQTMSSSDSLNQLPLRLPVSPSMPFSLKNLHTLHYYFVFILFLKTCVTNTSNSGLYHVQLCLQAIAETTSAVFKNQIKPLVPHKIQTGGQAPALKDLLL